MGVFCVRRYVSVSLFTVYSVNLCMWNNNVHTAHTNTHTHRHAHKLISMVMQQCCLICDHFSGSYNVLFYLTMMNVIDVDFTDVVKCNVREI